MKKADKEAAADKGGFVGGKLRDNRRKIETVACRSMLTLDVDHAEVGFIEKFTEGCSYAAVLYTTHGHKPEAPRVRLLLPLTNDISADKYAALARFFADEWGIDQFDECSYKPNQLMYWPTTPSNGEYICQTVEGDWLDADAYLEKHLDWKDCSLLPTSSRESAVRESAKKPQEDPLTKPGTVGVFCRAYGIAAAIEKFLSDVYTPSVVEGRFDYIPGEGCAGVVIYDDKFAYSHHATDPACGKLVNAFDLVRIHRFGNDDGKKSFADMCEFAMQDDAVKLLAMQEKLSQAETDFAVTDTDWMTRLHYQPRTGILENSVYNLNLILNNAPDFANFAFNELANRIQITGPLPWERPEGNMF